MAASGVPGQRRQPQQPGWALVTARHSRGLQTCVRARGDRAVPISTCRSDKAVVVMGLAPEGLAPPACGRGGALRSRQLWSRELDRLERRGRPVIAVVASAGTTCAGRSIP